MGSLVVVCSDGSFARWTACVGDCPGHVYALSTAQMSQMEAIFGGDAVKTAIMAIIYTADGGAEQVAWAWGNPW